MLTSWMVRSLNRSRVWTVWFYINVHHFHCVWHPISQNSPNLIYLIFSFNFSMIFFFHSCKSLHLSLQVFLIGVCLPMYAVHSSKNQWSAWDTLATMVCISGIAIAYFADTQLFNFVESNKKLKKIGEPTVPNLDMGLWRYSRHPNYFGEQLWWWGLVIFGWNVEQGWTFIGSLVNSMCLAYVTILVEQRMLKQENRAEAYRLYQKTTSVWIPWFKSTPRGEKERSN